jgi:hypothetical protein
MDIGIWRVLDLVECSHKCDAFSHTILHKSVLLVLPSFPLVIILGSWHRFSGHFAVFEESHFQVSFYWKVNCHLNQKSNFSSNVKKLFLCSEPVITETLWSTAFHFTLLLLTSSCSPFTVVSLGWEEGEGYKEDSKIPPEWIYCNLALIFLVIVDSQMQAGSLG